MDTLLSKKAALRRRASLSFLFSSQKPIFAALNDNPTRYYDFVDTLVPFTPQPPLIDRQDISPELESKIRYACSVLAYRIEQGVSSPPTNKKTTRPISQEDPAKDVPAKPHLESKLPPPNLSRPETAFKTGYDSGIELTHQPSMQTMRVLHSRSGNPSESGDTRTQSIFSNTNSRTGTSCSNTSAISSTEFSCTQSSDQSPEQNELQSMTGGNVTGCAQKQDHDKKAFLSGLSTTDTESQDNNSDNVSEDIEVFLNSDRTVNGETTPSNSSPSLGITKAKTTSSDQQPNSLTDQDTSKSNSKQNGKLINHRSIIIDSTGRACILTPDEESQRNKALQQAVIAKMKPGFMNYNLIRQPSLRGDKKRQATGEQDETVNNSNDCDIDFSTRRGSRVSRLGFGFSKPQTPKGAVLKGKVRQSHDVDRKPNSGSSVFGRFSKYLFPERSNIPSVWE